ncbi:MAG: hypothetical protein ACJA2G_000816, partial [Cognaticolwellia sp.]
LNDALWFKLSHFTNTLSAYIELEADLRINELLTSAKRTEKTS